MLFLVEGYLAVIALGTILLSCPFSLQKDLSILDAFFTATSAVCVTGLSVIDIGTTFTHAGLWILAALIQIGGLGIMTFSTTILLLSGMKPGFNQQALFKSGFTTEGGIEPKKILTAVLPFTIVLEGLGMTALFTQFDHLPLNERILYSVFHAISAFCNAGFSPLPNSLMSYQFNPVVCLVVILLVLAGGIGFLSMSEIKNLFDFKTRTIQKISLHTKIALTATLIISLIEMFSVLAIEWHGAFDGQSWAEKLLSGAFVALSSRTAGFNTIDPLSLRETSTIIIIIAMFIGASPGSCGGGLKTTTAAVITLLGINRLLGRDKTRQWEEPFQKKRWTRPCESLSFTRSSHLSGRSRFSLRNTRPERSEVPIHTLYSFSLKLRAPFRPADFPLVSPRSLPLPAESLFVSLCSWAVWEPCS